MWWCFLPDRELRTAEFKPADKTGRPAARSADPASGQKTDGPAALGHNRRLGGLAHARHLFYLTAGRARRSFL